MSRSASTGHPANLKDGALVFEPCLWGMVVQVVPASVPSQDARAPRGADCVVVDTVSCELVSTPNSLFPVYKKGGLAGRFPEFFPSIKRGIETLRFARWLRRLRGTSTRARQNPSQHPIHHLPVYKKGGVAGRFPEFPSIKRGIVGLAFHRRNTSRL
jgi:hypothetical protein